MLWAKRIVHYLVEHFPATVYNQPPDPHAYPSTREGGVTAHRPVVYVNGYGIS